MCVCVCVVGLGWLKGNSLQGVLCCVCVVGLGWLKGRTAYRVFSVVGDTRCVAAGAIGAPREAVGISGGARHLVIVKATRRVVRGPRRACRN